MNAGARRSGGALPGRPAMRWQGARGVFGAPAPPAKPAHEVASEEGRAVESRFTFQQLQRT